MANACVKIPAKFIIELMQWLVQLLLFTKLKELHRFITLLEVSCHRGLELFMANKKVYVADSGIHGKGLFAKDKIAKGELIGKVKSKVAKKDGPYVLWLEDANKPREVTCELKYINHSRKPNAAYYDDLTVVALKTIKPGDEITHHYGDDWD